MGKKKKKKEIVLPFSLGFFAYDINKREYFPVGLGDDEFVLGIYE